MIPWELRRFEQIVAIGVTLDKANALRQIFTIPTRLFNEAGILTIKEGDEYFSQNIIRKEKVKDWICAYARSVEETLCTQV